MPHPIAIPLLLTGADPIIGDGPGVDIPAEVVHDHRPRDIAGVACPDARELQESAAGRALVASCLAWLEADYEDYALEELATFGDAEEALRTVTVVVAGEVRAVREDGQQVDELDGAATMTQTYGWLASLVADGHHLVVGLAPETDILSEVTIYDLALERDEAISLSYRVHFLGHPAAN